MAANAERLGIDARRIAVGGDSAGGNLATVVAMRCRDAGGPALAAQVLIYPVTDSALSKPARIANSAKATSSPARRWNGLPAITWHPPIKSAIPEVSPLLAPNLSGLPPALVITAEFDPLRDEGEAYAKRLQQAGVPVTISRYPGMIHGFVSMRGVLAGGRQAIQEAAQFTAAMSK